MKLVVRNLYKSGYNVVSYDVTKSVFYSANPEILKELIHQIKADINNKIKSFKTLGIDDFGFFGSSIGSFILFNCVSSISELRWGIFNTGGNIARGMWKIKKARNAHIRKGITLQKLESLWHESQFPEFKNLQGNRYIFVSSSSDKIAPLEHVDRYLDTMRQAGAVVKIKEIKAAGHLSAVMNGLRLAPRLVKEVKNLP